MRTIARNSTIAASALFIVVSIGFGSIANRDVAADATSKASDTGAANLPLTWGYDATAPAANWVKPPLLSASADPIYRTPIRRMTSAGGTRFDRNTYSRRQAENSDGTLLLSYHGDAEYHVYDRATGELLKALPIHPDAEPQWRPTKPLRIRHIAGANESLGDLKLYELNLKTGSDNVVTDLTSRIQSRIPSAVFLADRAEGSPSADGNRFAWIVHDRDGNRLGLVSYDVASDTVLGMLAPLRPNDGDLDWVSMSPTGSYIVAGYWYGTFVYDADLSNERLLNFKADHSDIALKADGGDAYVYIDFSDGPDAGFLVSIDLKTLERQRLFEIYGGANTSLHVSGKGYDRPGWVVVSTYNCKDSGAWTCDKILVVELAEPARVLNLAHTYNCGDNYWSETQAVVNREFSRVYFNSDGGSCGIDAEVYELTLPTFE
ncbi:MAG: hypothetical protein V3V01_14815 [Acidimicrobiales bacterium]